MIMAGSRFDYENDGCATVGSTICEGDGWKFLTFDDGYSNWYQFQDLSECDVSCFNAGDRVMIIPGTRYSNENDGCATVSTRICEGDWYKLLTFDDGYRNYYQHEDLMACSGAVNDGADGPEHRECDGKPKKGEGSCKEFPECVWRSRKCQSVAAVIKQQLDRQRKRGKAKWCKAFAEADEILCDDTNWRSCRKSSGGGVCNWSWRKRDCRPKYLLKLYQGLDQDDQDRVLAENNCLGDRPEPESRRKEARRKSFSAAANTRAHLARETLLL